MSTVSKTPMSSCEHNLGVVRVHTRILISDVSVFRMFTYSPIDGSDIKHRLLSNFAVRVQALCADMTQNNIFLHLYVIFSSRILC